MNNLNLKPWCVFAVYPDRVAPKPLDTFVSRNEAECLAQRLRRVLPPTIKVFACWNGGER